MQPLQEYIENSAAQVETRLSEIVGEENTPYRSLFRAARYTLLSSGKRLRPILALATAEALGADPEAALTPVCALEMVHTYSLIHDDLPCMDDSSTRRGKASLHTVVPEGQAVLAGDFLLTSSFEVLATAPSLTAEQRLALIESLASRSGAHGMIGGQVIDLASDGQKPDLDTLQTLASMKTGALITASLEFGGIIAAADEETMLILQTIGEAIGLAFQIVDDILDAATDEAQNKATYVSLLGLEQALDRVEKLEVTIRQAIDALPGDGQRLHQLAQLITTRNA